MIELQEREDGIVFALRVRPGGKRNSILGEHDGALKISVAAAPEKGKANTAVVKLLAESLAVLRGDLHLVRGQTSSAKEVLLVGLDRESLRARLASLIGAG